MPGISTVFFTEAVIGEHLRDKSRANSEANPCELLGDLVPIKIGLVAEAEDKRLELSGSFRCALRSRPLRQQVRRQPVEDGVANVVVGLTRLEAEGLGKPDLRKIAEFTQSDQADLLLDRLFRGEGDDLAISVGKNKCAVFGDDFDIERNIQVVRPP